MWFILDMRGRGRRIADDPAYGGRSSNHGRRGSRKRAKEVNEDLQDLDPELQEALRASLMDLCQETAPRDVEIVPDDDEEKTKLAEEVMKVIRDPKQLRQILGELPGVDPFDPRFDKYVMGVELISISD